jgi:mevalonate kinase
MKKEFYSNGKLLLTGEYAVLDGAKSLAVPTKFGQFLSVVESNTGEIKWQSLNDRNKPWFTADLTVADFRLKQTSHMATANRLVEILSEIKNLNPSFLQNSTGVLIESRLTFPNDWGLGSSSTLINNMAQWAKIDPYQLLATTFGGSGYDIACAQNNSAIVYSKADNTPIIDPVDFNPSFKKELYFVHLNKKQNSRDAIKTYRNVSVDKKALVSAINLLTEQMIQCQERTTFEQVMDAHEDLISKTLSIPTIKKQEFKDYPGSIKSLGAWGGDFVMVTGTLNDMDYFRKKGFATILPFSKMIL